MKHTAKRAVLHHGSTGIISSNFSVKAFLLLPPYDRKYSIMSDSEDGDDLVVGFSTDSSLTRLLPRRERPGHANHENNEQELQSFENELSRASFERGNREEVTLEDNEGDGRIFNKFIV